MITLALLACESRQSTDPNGPGFPIESDSDSDSVWNTKPTTENFTVSGKIVVGGDRTLPLGDVHIVLFGIETQLAGLPDAGWMSVNVGPLTDGEIPFEIEVPGDPPVQLFDFYPYNWRCGYGSKYETEAHVGIGAYINSNETGPDATDVYVGVYPGRLIYSYYDGYTSAQGWNHQLADGTQSPVTGNLTGIDVPANLLPLVRNRLSVEIVNDRAGNADQHFALIHDDIAEQQPIGVVSPVNPAAGTVLEAALPIPEASAEQDHLQNIYSMPHMRFSPYVGVVWPDANGNDLPDEPAVAITDEALSGVRAMYARPVWFATEWQGDGTGWHLTKHLDTQILVPWDDGMVLDRP